jgi:8-oxo-dGTP diphosphatase
MAMSDTFKLQEHAQALWLNLKALHTLDWAEADLPVLAAYSSWLEDGRQ